MARRFCRTNGCAMSHPYIVSLPKIAILEQIVMMNRAKEKMCVYCLCLCFFFFFVFAMMKRGKSKVMCVYRFPLSSPWMSATHISDLTLSRNI